MRSAGIQKPPGCVAMMSSGIWTGSNNVGPRHCAFKLLPVRGEARRLQLAQRAGFVTPTCLTRRRRPYFPCLAASAAGESATAPKGKFRKVFGQFSPQRRFVSGLFWTSGTLNFPKFKYFQQFSFQKCVPWTAGILALLSPYPSHLLGIDSAAF